MSKTALIVLSEGAEEIEAVIPANVLRRAGVKVTIAGLESSSPVTCSRDTVIVPDASLADAIVKGPYDAVILPGGLKGSQNLAASDKIKALLSEQEKAGRVIGAICAAPALVFTAFGIGEGKSVTSYPSLKDKIISNGKHTYLEERVVVDGSLITSRGPGTAFEFAVALVDKLMGSETAKSTADPLLLK